MKTRSLMRLNTNQVSFVSRSSKKAIAIGNSTRLEISSSSIRKSHVILNDREFSLFGQLALMQLNTKTRSILFPIRKLSRRGHDYFCFPFFFGRRFQC